MGGCYPSAHLMLKNIKIVEKLHLNNEKSLITIESKGITLESLQLVKELISKGKSDYESALRLLDAGDVYDAAEKAWSAIENFRKACLVAAKIPYDIAKTVGNGVPLFSKILEKLGKKDLLCMYFYFNSRLHSLGFYERVIPEEDIAKMIQEEVPKWLENIEQVVNTLKSIDLSETVEVLRKINQARQEALRASAKYAELRRKLDTIISNKISIILNK